MADSARHGGLSTSEKVIGTVFLLFQLLFAVNNYGPQRIPVLSWL